MNSDDFDFEYFVTNNLNAGKEVSQCRVEFTGCPTSRVLDILACQHFSSFDYFFPHVLSLALRKSSSDGSETSMVSCLLDI